MTHVLDHHIDPVAMAPHRDWRARAMAYLLGTQPIATLPLRRGAVLEITSGVPIVTLALVAFFAWLDRSLVGAALALTLFLSVLAHELGHSLAGRLAGSRTLLIRVGGLSGLCVVEKMTGRGASIRFALFGPLANALVMLIALAATVVLMLWSGPVAEGKLPRPPLDPATLELIAMIMFMNAILCVVNLLPVRPFDGGAILHLALGAFLPDAKTTRICGAVGLACAVAVPAGAVAAYLTWNVILPLFPPIRPSWQMLRNGVIPAPARPAGA